MFCKSCGSEIVSEEAVVCVSCGVSTGNKPVAGANEKPRILFILLGFFLGSLGIHNFYAGYTKKGVAQLLITLFLGWLVIPWIAVEIWALIEIITVTEDVNGNKFS